jgi:hypothetical protein
MKKAIYFVLIVVTIFFAELARAQNGEPVDVPLIRLIVVPNQYNGVIVRTIGYVRFEFEGDVMYPHKEDYEHGLVGNGIWIDSSDLDQKQLNECSGHCMKYCLIVATFDANKQGHLGMWSGSFRNIKRFEVWSGTIPEMKRGGTHKGNGAGE